MIESRFQGEHNAPRFQERNMPDLAVEVVARLLTWMFAIGAVGCMVVIPMVAYRLVRVLFEEDRPDEV